MQWIKLRERLAVGAVPLSSVLRLPRISKQVSVLLANPALFRFLGAGPFEITMSALNEVVSNVRTHRRRYLI